MAATYPQDVVQAQRFLRQNPNLRGPALDDAVARMSWDPSVQSLTAFPQVLDMMSARMDWTRRLGDAYLSDQDWVMDTVQDLRWRAHEAGNLASTPQQTVMVEDRTIYIQPAAQDVVYVPTYNPLVIYGPWWAPAYTPYYWRPPRAYYPGVVVTTGYLKFGVPYRVTVNHWGWARPDWRQRHIVVDVQRPNMFVERRPVYQQWAREGWWEHRRAEARFTGSPPARGRDGAQQHGPRDAGQDRGEGRGGPPRGSNDHRNDNRNGSRTDNRTDNRNDSRNDSRNDNRGPISGGTQARQPGSPLQSNLQPSAPASNVQPSPPAPPAQPGTRTRPPREPASQPAPGAPAQGPITRSMPPPPREAAPQAAPPAPAPGTITRTMPPPPRVVPAAPPAPVAPPPQSAPVQRAPAPQPPGQAGAPPGAPPQQAVNGNAPGNGQGHGRGERGDRGPSAGGDRGQNGGRGEHGGEHGGGPGGENRGGRQGER